MDINNFKLKDYKVVDSILRLNREFKNDDLEDEIDVDVAMEAHATSSRENLLSVNLKIDIFNECEKNNYPFELKFKIVGFFEVLNESLDFENENFEKKYIEIGIKELFPYVRSFVSSITSSAGIPPLLLPPFDIKAITAKKKE